MPADLTPLAEHAARMVPDGAAVGLGTGRAAEAFLHALAGRVKSGLRVRGVPTSVAVERLATSLGVPVTTLDEVESLDVAFDGADEVDPAGDLIKGYGGALVREKIVATAARRFVVLVGGEKLVPVLGTRGKLPVEVVPFAVGPCRRALRDLGLSPTVRERDGRPFRSDNGNAILDCGTGLIADPAGLDAAVRAIPGVVGTGLFVGFRPTVLVQTGEGVSERPGAS